MENYILRAHNGKSAGPDELFVDMYMWLPKQMAEILSLIWQKCGSMRYILEPWSNCTLIPIYRKGETHIPESYRPIAVLSHARKIIESAIANVIEKQVTFDAAQLGFRKKTSTEVALIRTTSHLRNGLHHIAVLHLKSAYNEVPRKNVLQLQNEGWTAIRQT